MPQNIASAVTPAYSSQIPVPLDGEYANNVALGAMVLPVANRVEYLRQRIETAPWTRAVIFDDFSKIAQADADRVFSDTVWSMSGTKDANITLVDGSAGADEFGVMRIQDTSGSGATFRIYKSFDAFRFVNFRRMVARVRTSVVQANHDLEIGMLRSTVELPWDTSVPSSALSFGFQGAAAPWKLRTNDGTTNGQTNSAIPVVASTWYVLDLRYDGASQADLYVNGVLAATRNLTLPVGTLTGTPQLKFATGTTGTRNVDVDFIYFEGATPNRVF
jgi:hypothetical protein